MEHIDLLVEEKRLSSMTEAARRTRLAFAVLTLAAIVQIATVWNAYVSWIRLFVLQAKESEVLHNDGPQSGRSIISEQLLRIWVDSTYINVPFLGIRVSIHDASVIGSLTIVVLSLWFFYCIRRENHLMAEIFRSSMERKSAQRRRRRKDPAPQAVDLDAETLRDAFVYHGVIGTQVFATVQTSDRPIWSVTQAAEGSSGGLVNPRHILKAVMFLPTLAVLLVVLFDFLSLFILKSPFRDGQNILVKHLVDDQRSLVQAVMMLTIGFGMTIVTGMLNIQAFRFQSACTSLLREAYDGGMSRSKQLDEHDNDVAPTAESE